MGDEQGLGHGTEIILPLLQERDIQAFSTVEQLEMKKAEMNDHLAKLKADANELEHSVLVPAKARAVLARTVVLLEAIIARIPDVAKANQS